MADSPYDKWDGSKGQRDYRSRETQASSFTRNLLSDPEYLYSSNRVNPGPLRNTRASISDSKTQLPHDFGDEDLWGWSDWQEEPFKQSDMSDTLLE